MTFSIAESPDPPELAEEKHNLRKRVWLRETNVTHAWVNGKKKKLNRFNCSKGTYQLVPGPKINYT